MLKYILDRPTIARVHLIAHSLGANGLLEALDDGHCALPRDRLLRTAEELLEIPRPVLEEALGRELLEERLIADAIDHDDAVFLAHLWRAERLIAERLRAEGTVDIHAVDESPELAPDADLVLIGSPTEGHAAAEEARRFLGASGTAAWSGRLVATFETRVAWPRLLSGSAALDLRRRLTALGATVIRSDGSFIVSMTPDLKPGELERAAAWTASVLASRARLRAVGAP